MGTDAVAGSLLDAAQDSPTRWEYCPLGPTGLGAGIAQVIKVHLLWLIID